MRWVILLVTLTCACRPQVELRSVMPATDFCRPQHYNKPLWRDYSDHHAPSATVHDDGLFVDGVQIAGRRSDWSREPLPSSSALPDGRWVITFAGRPDPGETLLDSDYPNIMYVWDPKTQIATYVGHIYWYTDYPLDDFFLLVRGAQLLFADIDPDLTTAHVRTFDVFAKQTIAGYSAGTAVTWKRDGSTVTLSCLGDAARTVRVSLAADLHPIVDQAVHDQRVLVQTRPHNHGTSDVWVIDLDRRRVRFIGNAPSVCQSAFRSSYPDSCFDAAYVAWLGPDPVSHGLQLLSSSWVSHVVPTTEAIVPFTR
jgi:hypothetical protein